MGSKKRTKELKLQIDPSGNDRYRIVVWPGTTTRIETEVVFTDYPTPKLEQADDLWFALDRTHEPELLRALSRVRQSEFMSGPEMMPWAGDSQW